jgi:hypothetical protein
MRDFSRGVSFTRDIDFTPSAASIVGAGVTRGGGFKRNVSFARGAIIAMAALAMTLFFSSVVRADEVYVTDSANLLDDPSSAGHLLTVLQKGDRLEVVSRQGDWIQVQFATFTGWVLAAQVSNNAPGFDLGGLLGGNNAAASDTSAASAGKGIGPMATQWASGKGLDTSMCVKMENDRNAITAQDLKDFDNSPEGKLGK